MKKNGSLFFFYHGDFLRFVERDTKALQKIHEVYFELLHPQEKPFFSLGHEIYVFSSSETYKIDLENENEIARNYFRSSNFEKF